MHPDRGPRVLRRIGRRFAQKHAPNAHKEIRVTISDIAPGPAMDAIGTTSIVVCTTCRRPGDADDAPRPGAELAHRTARAAHDAGVAVRRVACLANCKRGCSAAIVRAGGWAYVFGDLDAANAAAALVEGARLLAGSIDGLMSWRGRPEPLKRGMIARVPPLAYEEAE
jgi:predicted metal-binding protein